MYLACGIHPIGMDLHAETSLMEGVEESYDTPEQKVALLQSSRQLLPGS